MGGGWRWRDGEEGAFVGLGVADQGGDIMVGQERVCEDFRRRKPGQCVRIIVRTGGMIK